MELDSVLVKTWVPEQHRNQDFGDRERGRKRRNVDSGNGDVVETDWFCSEDPFGHGKGIGERAASECHHSSGAVGIRNAHDRHAARQLVEVADIVSGFTGAAPGWKHQGLALLKLDQFGYHEG